MWMQASCIKAINAFMPVRRENTPAANVYSCEAHPGTKF